VPERITEESPATYRSSTRLNAIGCIMCGDMEVPSYVDIILNGSIGSIPVSAERDTDDDALRMDAGNLAIPTSLDAVRKRTQLEVAVNVGA